MDLSFCCKMNQLSKDRPLGWFRGILKKIAAERIKILCSKIKLHFHKSLLPSTSWHVNVKHTLWAISVWNTVLLNRTDHNPLLLGILHNIARFQPECREGGPWWARQEHPAGGSGLWPMSKRVLSPELTAKTRPIHFLCWSWTLRKQALVHSNHVQNHQTGSCTKNWGGGLSLS